MGCCESHHSLDKNMDLQFRTYYNSTGQNAIFGRENNRMVTRPDYDIVKVTKKGNSIDSEIPLTKEVKVPSTDIPLDVIQNKKRLSLTIFESKFLNEGTVLNITPAGLEGSERMAKDGIDEILNDFNFPDEEVIGRRHFEIKYDLLRDVYRIKNLFGSGLFLLRNNAIFSFSTSHLIVKISMNTNEECTEATEGEVINSSISLKVIHGINENNEYTFDSKKQTQIKIGRLPVNGIDISFNEESTSRVQCTIFYEYNNWYIVDGDGLKLSLNGTWFLADEYMDIYEGMIFRAGTTSFQSHLWDPK